MEGFLELPPVLKKSGQELSLLIDRAEEIVKGLSKIGCPVDQYDNWFVHLLV